ncbi:MAG: M48 family metallopeptidase [Cyclobacteriaceae bacterium]|nr:M48 family metallopeptidase [Cyclobacteriaceae bacterium]
MIRTTSLLSLLAIALYACATVAVSGRKQLNLVPNSELIPMAQQQYAEVIAKGPLSTNREQTDMIKRVGGRIQRAVEKYMADNGRAAELDGFAWEFNLIQDDQTVNAWCMPGGKVAFYTGILPICKDETGVAIVMGHEVAHAVANHGRERMSQQMAAQFGMNTFAVLMGQNPTGGEQLLMQAIGAGTNLGMLKFSRAHESEADYLGVIFMAMGGYDPRQAPAFWERMAALSGGQQPPEFLSTHPSHDTRIKDLQGWIPQAMTYYKP